MILFVDDHLVVVNKPAGLPTLVDGYDASAPYLLGILKNTYPALWVVHRLDKETSGVIAFARSAAAHRELNTQFEQRQVFKCYLALVHGQPEWTDKTIRLSLRANGDRHHRTVVDHQKGKSAVTELFVLERFADCTLIQAIPHTGRTHQIRAHLAALAHPIVGDVLYHGRLISGFERIGLHASLLRLHHPISGAELEFTAPLPNEMEAVLVGLRRGASIVGV